MKTLKLRFLVTRAWSQIPIKPLFWWRKGSKCPIGSIWLLSVGQSRASWPLQTSLSKLSFYCNEVLRAAPLALYGGTLSLSHSRVGAWQLRNPAGSKQDSLTLPCPIPFVIHSNGGAPNPPIPFVPHWGDLIMVLAEAVAFHNFWQGPHWPITWLHTWFLLILSL